MIDQERLNDLIKACKYWGSSLIVNDYLLKNGIIVLPCSIGDTVYWNTNTYISNGVVATIQITTSEIIEFVALSDYDGKSVLYKEFDKSDIGETVFLTKEEAENHLKEGDK